MRDFKRLSDLDAMRELVVRAARYGAEIDTTTNEERRAAVLAHPDLADRLTKHPLFYTRPEQWHGYIPPEQWHGVPNNSPERAALVEIYDEALRRQRRRVA
ncbi:hypothetical protein GCM10027294_43570 [Marinactinospora endophytica]